MPKRSLSKPNGKWFHDHLLSIALLSLFLLSWVGQLYFQYLHELDEARQHGAASLALFSADFQHSFRASTFENWQSEFLQMFTFIVMTTYLIHRHSPESRDTDDEMAADIRAIKQKLQV